jgi:hypothetical protein
MSRYQKAGQKHSVKIAISSFEDVAKFKYLRKPLTDQNCMIEEMRADQIRGMLATVRSRVVFPTGVHECKG